MAGTDGKLHMLQSFVLPQVAETHFSLAKASGKSVDPRKLPSLKVSVSSKVSSVPVDAEPPVIENYPDITEHIISNASMEAGHILRTS